MKLTILQRDIVWGDPAANAARLEETLGQLPEADLYVLPEMFSTGFATLPEGIAEEGPEPPSLLWMKRMAAAKNAAIAGSIALHTTDGLYRNRFYFVKPDGSVAHYDKHHLFTYGGEHLRYSAGGERTVVEWRGVRVLLQVCYDLRFPLWGRNRGDYDLALYVASWPASRSHAWSTLLRARAIENQCYVAGVNRIGSDPACLYCGASAIIDPYGLVAADCAENTECHASANIDMEALRAFRKKFPVLDDADDYEVKSEK